MQQCIIDNLEWMKSGKIGCTFASYFARIPESIGWTFEVSPINIYPSKKCLIWSGVFPGCDQTSVREWAIINGCYIEELGEGCEGLRYQFEQGVSWVQYFGPDADVITRQAPHPMLMMTVKLPIKYYAKVGFNGILHLAHACVSKLSKFAADTLWETSFRNTAKQLGKKPGLKEAAKTTYHV